MGHWRSGSEILGFACAGVRVPRFKSPGRKFPNTFSAPSLARFGSQELAALVADVSKTKYTYAFTDGQMCSAAYWLASQADAIFATPSARVGECVFYGEGGTFAIQGSAWTIYDSKGAKTSEGKGPGGGDAAHMGIGGARCALLPAGMPHRTGMKVRDRALCVFRDPVHVTAESERAHLQTFHRGFFDVIGLPCSLRKMCATSMATPPPSISSGRGSFRSNPRTPTAFHHPAQRGGGGE